MKKTENKVTIENKKQNTVKCSLDELVTMADSSAVMFGSIQNGSSKTACSKSLIEHKN